MVKAASNVYKKIEKRITLNVSNGDVNKPQYRFLMFYTELGSTFGAGLVFVLLIALSGWKILPLVFIYLTQLGIVELIKFLFKTPRPNYLKKHDNIFGFDTTSSSFPSGHTSNAFTMAFLISGFYQTSPIVSIILYLTACAVAVSRIYLGKHYLVDIIGGIVIGLSVSYITWHILVNNGLLVI